jgi:hypothetical protein
MLFANSKSRRVARVGRIDDASNGRWNRIGPRPIALIPKRYLDSGRLDD